MVRSATSAIREDSAFDECANGSALSFLTPWSWGELSCGLFCGAGLQHLAGPVRRRLPALSAVALVVVGLVAVASRFEVPALSTAAAGDGSSIEEAVACVESLDPEASCHDPAP